MFARVNRIPATAVGAQRQLPPVDINVMGRGPAVA